MQLQGVDLRLADRTERPFRILGNKSPTFPVGCDQRVRTKIPDQSLFTHQRKRGKRRLKLSNFLITFVLRERDQQLRGRDPMA